MSKAIQHRYFIPGFAEHSPKPGIKKYSPLKGWALRLLGYALKYNGSYLNKKSAVKLINSHPRSFLLTNHLKKNSSTRTIKVALKRFQPHHPNQNQPRQKNLLPQQPPLKKTSENQSKLPQFPLSNPKTKPHLDWIERLPTNFSLLDAQPTKYLTPALNYDFLNFNIDWFKLNYIEFKQLPKESQSIITKALHLDNPDSAIQQVPNGLTNLDRLPQSIQKQLTIQHIYDFQINANSSRLKYAFLNEKEFKDLSLESLNCYFSKEQRDFILLRAKHLLQQVDRETVPFTFPQDFKKIQLIDIIKMTPAEVNLHAMNLPQSAFFFLEISQLKEIDFLKLSKLQIETLFCLLSEKEIKTLFSIIKEDVFVKLVHDQKLTSRELRYLSEKQFNSLKLSNLSKNQLREIFHLSIDPTTRSARFATFNPLDMATAIKAGKFSTAEQLSLLTAAQLNELPLSELKSYAIKLIFPYSSFFDTKNVERLKFVPISEVILAIINKELDEPYLLQNLSELHLKALPLSRLKNGTIETIFPKHGLIAKKNAERLKLVPVSEVIAAIINGELNAPYLLQNLSEEHLKELLLSKLKIQTIETIFPWKGPLAKKNAFRFNLIPASEVIHAIKNQELYTSYLLKLLSEAHLKILPLSEFSSDTIETIFPQYGPLAERNAKRLKLVPVAEVTRAIINKKLNAPYLLEKLSKEHLKDLFLSEVDRDTLETVVFYVKNKGFTLNI